MISTLLFRILGLQLVLRGRNMADGVFLSQINLQWGRPLREQYVACCSLAPLASRFSWLDPSPWSFLKCLMSDGKLNYFLEGRGEAFDCQNTVAFISPSRKREVSQWWNKRTLPCSKEYSWEIIDPDDFLGPLCLIILWFSCKTTSWVLTEGLLDAERRGGWRSDVYSL